MADIKDIRSASDLAPDARNANEGTERGRSMLGSSLGNSGAVRSIAVDKDGSVIAGNKTLQAWVEEHGDEVVVVRTKGDKLVVVQREDLDFDSDDPDVAARTRLAAYYDNRASEVGLSWDAQQIAWDVDDGLSLDAIFTNTELDAIFQTKDIEPPEDFGEYDDDLDTEYRCPKCGYEWSGSPN